MAEEETETKLAVAAMTSQELAKLALEDAMLADHSSGDDSSGDDDGDIRPSIADQQKVGFFSQDRATQTERSDIINLKEMTKDIQGLLKESQRLKRELAVTKQVMQADYENRLQEKTLDMYVRINERVEELQKMHSERVEIVRRSFRQQLADAIVKLNNDWKKHAGLKMQAEQRRLASKNDQMGEDYEKLVQQVAQQEGIIDMLRMQIAQIAQEPRSEASTPSAVYEVEHLRDEMGNLQQRIDSMEEAMDAKDEQIDELNKDVERLTKDLEKERVQVKQLLHELEESKATAQQELASLRRNADKQRLQMEREMQDKMSKARDEMVTLARKHAKEAQQQEEERQRILEEQRKAALALEKKERENALQASKSDTDINRLRKMETFLKLEVARLKKELARTTRMWEKKFAILQKSLYALKDESFVRQTLQKQAATLHHASVSYAADTPLGILPSSQPTNTPRRQNPPLPGIGQMSKVRDPRLDLISPYTVSPPSGRGVELFSAAASQIVDNDEADEDSDVEGVIPLPSPPPKWKQDSRPSTSGQVIVLPTA
ncbi:uncharacterized protein C10orf67, mitochondrial-like isoform X2 [Acanthaster planci]|uniref:Uncharacterized protein C10orf67, mitochondrial-like isoform X2 n=1 Tax=Acanthaster planci TaxID=133434 RepID=A0A8B7Y0T6_ACAPL|nr:uncharacterized protein C10orf67, mitochondrial-like isoform X2 [Acanthaster planci]